MQYKPSAEGEALRSRSQPSPDRRDNQLPN